MTASQPPADIEPQDTGHLNVRLADFGHDALAIVEGARNFVARMDFTEFLPTADEDFVAAVARVVTLPGMEVAVAEHGGRVVGGLGMLYGPCLWNPALLTADELFWWAAPDAPRTTALRLLRFACDRAAERCAVVTFKSLTSSPAGVDRVYRRMGLRPVETSYMGVV